jgi:large conductance mechanosensitive channel
MKGFINFIRSQGVIGLAVGFIMGGSITKLITSFVTDIINPVVGLLIGSIGDLKNVYLQVGPTRILFGDFFSSLIDFLIITFIVYFMVKLFGVNNKKDSAVKK